MSEAEDRSSRIRERIAASQERLDRDSAGVPMVPRRDPLPDAWPPEDYRSLAREYPWLTVAAGFGLGLLAGALLPKRAGSKLGKRAMAVATVAAEMGLALSREARDSAGEKARDGLARVEQGTAPLRQRAGRAGQAARGTGMRLAGQAIKLASRLRK